jgi:hypothetical protein
MNEVLPGIFHWTTFHEGIGEKVHSYYIASTTPAVLIDPRVPEEGISWFRSRRPPQHIYLTNRHHYRHSGQFEEAFGARVWCHRDGLHEFVKGEVVHPFEHCDALPGGLIARKVAVLCPEETALYLPLHGGILSIGDAIIRYGAELGFVPDPLLGDNPEEVKRGLKAVFADFLLQGDFEHLLFAHGAPWIVGAKEGLERFLVSRR